VMIMIITLTTNKKFINKNSDAEEESSVACTCKRVYEVSVDLAGVQAFFS
jgi:hypothetical protein